MEVLRGSAFMFVHARDSKTTARYCSTEPSQAKPSRASLRRATHSLTSFPRDVAIIIASLKLALPPALFELGKDVPKDVPIR